MTAAKAKKLEEHSKHSLSPEVKQHSRRRHKS